jgi:sugar O-acyltransferase (sialic acid O-acetyltransferase NeuD family)
MGTPARIVIVGAGAQAKYALETFGLTNQDVCTVLSTTAERPEWAAHYGCRIGNFDGTAESLRRTGATQAIACAAKPTEKRRLIDAIEDAGLELVSAVHPSATIATTARLGRGVIVNAQAVIQPFAEVGDGAMIHAGVVVEHDGCVAAFVNLAPRVALAGWVRVGEGAVVNTGAVAIPAVEIGDQAVIAAGAVIIRDVPAHTLAAGVPAVVKRRLGDGSASRT